MTIELYVLDHHLDTEAGVYRLEVGVPSYDEDGQFAAIEALPDYVFAADDPKWAGREPADIAAEQRQIVTDKLNEQLEELAAREERQAAARVAMPGVGEAV